MGRYINAEQLAAIQPVFFGTAGMTPGSIEFFIETREDEIDARLGRYWNMQPFSGSAPSMLKTLTKLGAWVDVRKSKISMEDPSISQWIVQDETKFENLMTSLVSGTAELIAADGTVIARTSQLRDQVWSSTKGYKPTMDLRDPTRQRVSRTRLLDERDADLTDSWGAGGLGSGDV